jgi:Secretion system C-terminal sorting domain/Dockerin type I domain
VHLLTILHIYFLFNQQQFYFLMKKTNFTFLKGLAVSAMMALGIANVSAQGLSCQDHVNVSLDASCGVSLTAATFYAGTAPGGALVTIKDGTNTIAGPLATVAVADAKQWVGKTYTFEVAVGTNKCWGTVKFEDKLGPVFTACPANAAAPGGSAATAFPLTCTDAVPNVLAAIDCSAIVTNTSSDVTTGSLCAGTLVIARTWTAVDFYGNSSTCTVFYKVAKPDGVITIPAATSFSACAPKAADYGPAVAGWPSYKGGSITGTSTTSAQCQLGSTWTDKVAPSACGLKIIRTWVVIDYCSGNIVTAVGPLSITGAPVQVITIEDKTAPVFAATTVPAITISTGATTCTSDALIAPPAATDACSAVSYTVSIGTSTFAVTGGKARIQGLAIQPAAYLATWTATDACGNTATITQNISVRDLIAPTAVCDLDTKVALTQECVATVNAITFDDGSLDNCCLDVNAFRVARMGSTDFQPTITFNKADCGVVVMVQLRVSDCNGNSNICMVNVTVEDKIAPIAFGRDTIVCCGSTPSATAWLNAYVLPSKSLIDYPSATNAGYYDNCGATATRAQSGSIDNCGNGTVTHAWTVTDTKNKTTATANVRYISENRSAYMVTFPDDVELKCVTGNTNTSYATSPKNTLAPIIEAYSDSKNGATCPLVGVEYKDETFNIQNTGQGCFKILRTWKVLNWCQPLAANLAAAKGTGDAKLADPKTSVVRTGAQAVYRKFYNIDVLRPDRLSSVFAADAPCRDLMVAAAASYPSGADTDGYMEYVQVIKVIDTTIPTLTKGAVALEAIGKECRVKLSVGAPTADDCTGIVGTSYQLVNSSNVVVGGTTFGGTHTTNFGGSGELPFGKYTVRYIANDNCGNYASTDVAIDVKDVKKPTPVCFQGLSVDLMPTTGNVMIPCSAFNAGSYDNCPGIECFVQIPAPGPGASAPTNILTGANDMVTAGGPKGQVAKNVMFECVGYQTVALWIKDASNNWDYCETYVDVQNNMGAPNVPNCNTPTPPGGKVAAAVKTEAGNPAKALVSVIATGFPAAIVKPTQFNGFSGAVYAATGSKVEVSAENNTNPLNGVSTLDLVLISKHILGTQPIVSNYAKVAADVNNNGTISTADLVELRKMILGINTNFSNNTSWKFFGANMTEKVVIADLQADATVDFTAVKIGDVNGSADATLAAGRSTVNFNVADANVAAGEEVKVVMNNKNTEGFQFAMNYDAASLEVVSVDENSAVLENGTITTAQVGTDFAVTFKAKKNVTLSNAISLGSAINAEAVVNGTSANVAINFNNTVSGFALAQNQPNPFRGATVISFSTPVAGEYTLTITDMAGRTVQSTSANAVKGTNNVTVEMTSAGVFNYTVKTANFTATKKMVVIE